MVAMPEIAAPSASLRVRARAIPSDSPAFGPSLLDLLPADADPCAWLGPRRAMVGTGRALAIPLVGADQIRDAGLVWERVRRSAVVEAEPGAPAVPVALASFAFSSQASSVVLVPELLIIEDEAGRWAVSASAHGPAPDPLALAERSADRARTGAPRPPEGLTTGVGVMTQTQWTDAVAQMSRRLRAGEASKAVMTRDLPVHSPAPIDARYLLARLTDLYPQTWRFCVDRLIGATPEMLGAASGGRLHSRVLAGTAAPGCGEALMGSDKDRREHELAVASVVDALAPLTEDLEVPDRPFILDLPNVSHLASDVSASLEDVGLLDAIAALHPTAAVCGTPRADALRLLRELERTERGRYSGPVGWIDASDEGEFGLALRCGRLEDDGRTLRIFAGGGIMPDSDPLSELAETRAKMAPLLEALGANVGR